MIDIGKLYCGGSSTGDGLRYGEKAGPDCHGNAPHKTQLLASERRPIVVWSTTRSCNLHCVHCYTDSENKKYAGELSTDEGFSLIDDLAAFNIPSLLFSGGEPLTRKDVFHLIERASNRNIRPVLSTNGTLIDRDTAQSLKNAGVVYVGISLDGMEATNDEFRGMKGAFARAMKGFEHCVAIGQRVGLRLTLTKRNFNNLHAIFDFIEREGISRACFYHLVYSGRGGNMFSDDLTHAQSRQGGPPPDDMASYEDPVRQGLADDLDDHLGIRIELLGRRTEYPPFGMLGVIATAKLLSTPAADTQYVQFVPPS